MVSRKRQPKKRNPNGSNRNTRHNHDFKDKSGENGAITNASIKSALNGGESRIGNDSGHSAGDRRELSDVKEHIADFEIIYDDALKVLPKYPEKFDLIIADPPFGIQFDKKCHEYGSEGFILYDDNFQGSEYEEFSHRWISACYNALKKNGSMYIVSGWTNLGDILNAIKRTPFILKNHIIWYFEWGVYTKKKYVTSHYHILFLVKNDKDFKFKPYWVNPRSTRKGAPYEKDVWYWPRYNRGNDPDHIKGHPCQLPLMLLRKMLRISTDMGDWVCDLFSGSGGTLRACRELGRNCIAIEENIAFKPIIEQKAQVNELIIGREDIEEPFEQV